eukprot:TRINITY_DN6342_c2_g1_i2.p1 TRINITY_DN6342_c2_g1~~TRINITY_DN6342_c2_g1_i2.p1  ORF type:complete len:743 (+),score=131.40 TRINITY_DN6342_c2_g1_i2:44-2272(+)
MVGGGGSGLAPSSSSGNGGGSSSASSSIRPGMPGCLSLPLLREGASTMSSARGDGASSSTSALGSARATAPTPRRAVVTPLKTTIVPSRRVRTVRFPDAQSVQKALDLAGQCGRFYDEDHTQEEQLWERCALLQPILILVADSCFDPPECFVKCMETFAVCVLNAPEGHLHCASRMAEFLESSDAEVVLRYLEYLEPALRKVCPAEYVAERRDVVVPQRVRATLSSWPGDCGQLRQSVAGFVAALLEQAPRYFEACHDRRNYSKVRKSMHADQSSRCTLISQELEEIVSGLSRELKANNRAEWPDLACLTRTGLQRLEETVREILDRQNENTPRLMDEYEALGNRMRACSLLADEVHRNIQRHVQTTEQTANRFIEVFNQLVAWTHTLVPKLRALERWRKELRMAADLQNTELLTLERDKIDAEDELDAANTELRKHRRHAQAFARSLLAQSKVQSDSSMERQMELRVQHAEARAEHLADQLRAAEARFQAVAAELPLILEHGNGSGDAPSQQSADQEVSPSQRLALKLDELQRTHESFADKPLEEQTERERVVREIDQRRADEAFRNTIEADFMCPIMHEWMNDPVIAADGHTYERQAIVRWLQMHNTSPMTGAALQHRYLTENFALRHLMNSYQMAVLPIDTRVDKSSACHESPTETYCDADHPERLASVVAEDTAGEEDDDLFGGDAVEEEAEMAALWQSYNLGSDSPEAFRGGQADADRDMPSSQQTNRRFQRAATTP